MLSAGEIPQFLVSCVGPCLDVMSWDPVTQGIWTHAIVLSPGASGDLRLIKVEPGQSFPEHGHTGWELTLVLRGSYSDEFGTFRPGDVADLDLRRRAPPGGVQVGRLHLPDGQRAKAALFSDVDSVGSVAQG